jgi:hypothetical protein
LKLLRQEDEMEATARVIPWSNKAQQGKEKPPTVPVAPDALGGSATPGPAFSPIEGVLVVLPDEQLNALGTIFASSPLRKAMTFEGYLVVKGFGQPIV